MNYRPKSPEIQVGLAQRIAAAACFTCSAACVTAESVLVFLFLYWKASTFVLVTSKATCEASSCLLHLHLQRALHLFRQHTSAYVSIRQHTSAYVSIRQHTHKAVVVRLPPPPRTGGHPAPQVSVLVLLY
jgi:hypothetical protein